MESFPKRVADSILPLSVAGSLPEAFREWRFTGETVDHEVAEEICRLCGQEGLRYHFAIRNDLTGHRLDVGSECILRFKVAVFDRDREVGPDEARRVLADGMRRMRLESCMRALERLAAAEANAILANALAYYRRHGALTPRFANVVFWRLQANAVDHDPSFFKVRLDRPNYIADLRAMSRRDVHRIWRALSSAQRRRAQELGHAAPAG